MYKIKIIKKQYDNNDKKYVCELNEDIKNYLMTYKRYHQGYTLPKFSIKHNQYILHVPERFLSYVQLGSFNSGLNIITYNFTNSEGKELKGHYLSITSPYAPQSPKETLWSPSVLAHQHLGASRESPKSPEDYVDYEEVP